jgi:hypothetical protein
MGNESGQGRESGMIGLLVGRCGVKVMAEIEVAI